MPEMEPPGDRRSLIYPMMTAAARPLYEPIGENANYLDALFKDGLMAWILRAYCAWNPGPYSVFCSGCMVSVFQHSPAMEVFHAIPIGAWARGECLWEVRKFVAGNWPTKMRAATKKAVPKTSQDPLEAHRAALRAIWPDYGGSSLDWESVHSPDDRAIGSWLAAKHPALLEEYRRDAPKDT